MQRPRLVPVLGLLVTCAGALGAQEAPRSEGRSAEAEIRETVTAFHEALAEGDSTAALRRLHEDAVIYEGGHAETRSEYRSGHLAADIRFSGQMDRAVVRDAVTVGADMALYESEYRMTGRREGRELVVHGTETIVLASTEGGWTIRHIHWSSRRQE